MFDRRSALKMLGTTSVTLAMNPVSTAVASQSEFEEVDTVTDSTFDGTGVFKKIRNGLMTVAKRGGLAHAVSVLNRHSRDGNPQFEIGVAVTGEKKVTDNFPVVANLFEEDRPWYFFGSNEIRRENIGLQGTTVQVRNATVFEPDSSSAVAAYPKPDNEVNTDFGDDIAWTLLTSALSASGVSSAGTTAASMVRSLATASSNPVNDLDDKFTIKFNHDADEVGHSQFGHCFRFLVEPDSADEHIELDIMSNSASGNQMSVSSLETDDLDDLWDNSDDHLEQNEQQVGPDRLAIKYKLGYSDFYTSLYNIPHSVPDGGNERYTDWVWQDG